MTLVSKIEVDLTNALKSGDNFTKDTLRFLRSVIKNAEIELKSPLSDEQAVVVIQKEVKKRAEAQVLYNQANKPDLAASEAAEAEILKRYLPEQFDDVEIRTVINNYLADNPTDTSNIGPAMGALSAKFAGKADMGLVSKILRDQIQNG